MTELLKPTELRIEGLRTIERLRLPLEGLTVLIGDNGTGKSSTLEALEILRRVGASGSSFFGEFHAIHGGLASLMRMGARELRIGVSLGQGAGSLRYDLTLGRDGEQTTIVEETLLGGDAKPQRILDRTRASCSVSDQNVGRLVAEGVPPGQPALTVFGRRPPHRVINDVVDALAAIQVHGPFDVTPEWAARSVRRQSMLRSAVLIEGTRRLDLFGANLANVYASLRNDFTEDHWRETMDYVRLGLGPDVERVTTHPDPDGGRVALRLKYRSQDRQLPAAALSEGTLAYLAFVALFRLEGGTSLLAFDEPDLHLHPELLMRVVGFAEEMAKRQPVVFATHSDRLLDGLRDPQGAVLFELDERRSTVVKRPDRAELAAWLERYRGLGDLRAAGYEPLVMSSRSETDERSGA